MGRRSGGRLIPILRAMKELAEIRFRGSGAGRH
jgi:hypothetical protein